MTGAKLLLIHVSDGWVARNFNQLKLAESEEMKGDRAYLEKRSRELAGEGFPCDAVLALGEPSDEIIRLAREKQVRLYHPLLPESLQHVEISDLQLGDSSVDMVLERHSGAVSVTVNRRVGDIEVVTIT